MGNIMLDKLKNIHKETFCIEVEVLDGGKLPVKAHKTDAGFDLFATEDITISHGKVIKHPLNIRIKFPKNCWGRIETKSGLGAKGMLVWAGVIDEGYRGIPHVVCTCLIPQNPVILKKGDKIAQMTMNPHSDQFYIEQVDSVDTASDRGEGGFGSSGK